MEGARFDQFSRTLSRRDGHRRVFSAVAVAIKDLTNAGHGVRRGPRLVLPAAARIGVMHPRSTSLEVGRARGVSRRENVNGGIFTIADDLHCSGCAAGARCAGAVAASDRLLCIRLTDTVCTVNAHCPAGTACQTRLGQCVAPW